MAKKTDKKTAAIEAYIREVGKIWRTGVATEHSYRGALERLLRELMPGVKVVNEPQRVECGAPDYILTRRDLPVAFVEAKDIGDEDLDGVKRSGHREQFDRYKASLGTLAFTDYLDFRLWLHGEPAGTARIGEVCDNRIVPLPENYGAFLDLVEALERAEPRKVTTAPQLASRMAAKARLLCDAARRLLARDGYTGNPDTDSLLRPSSAVGRLMTVFRRVLVPNVTPDDFADIYAQTVVYGMFAARLHDKTPADFSRWEAAALVPKSNPFLRKLFAHLTTDGDPDADWIVDDIVALFGAADVRRILRDYGRTSGQRDPMIHFYEDFLDAYDPDARRKRGVWYTPLPVVQFIVRAADTLLATHFGFADGLADRARTEIMVPEGASSIPRLLRLSIPRIQVLDPATGTGTFLTECVNRIHAKFEGNEGLWPGYVRDELIPRLNGFELLMASYTMAHVKLDLVLAATGYTHTADSRFNVFLTDSLKEGFPAPSSLLFAEELSKEANAANFVKKTLPVMVVLGNPPYSVSSSNRGAWIQGLLEDYKQGLDEKKLNLDDDYIKFIRLGQHYIQRNGEGILAYISNNSFLDGITHRRMRQSLMETFGEIYIIDLHGNARKKETAPDGSKDENVFSIMQGVSINIFVKTRTHSGPCRVFHAGLRGRRAAKFAILEQTDFSDVPWHELTPTAPYYFFVPKDFSLEDEYKKGFSVAELFPVGGLGVKTERDNVTIHIEMDSLKEAVETFRTCEDAEIRRKFGLGNDSRDWSVARAKADIEAHYDYARYAHPIDYRAFDRRYIYYTGTSKGFVGTPGFSVMRHMLHDNLALCIIRNSRGHEAALPFVSDTLVGKDCVSSLDNCRVFPLYIYEGTLGQLGKQQNLNGEIVEEIAAAAGLEKAEPEDVFDYVYGILHTPDYRERYQEFLKVDFPRVPYPADSEEFRAVADLGRALRESHLVRDAPPRLTERTAAFPVAGDCLVEKAEYADGKVWINATQHFANVEEADWEAWVGGYQPAQKWLKDRRGRTLAPADLQHYRRIILSLRKTRSLMSELSTLWRTRHA